MAFFCTHGGSESQQLFAEVEALCERRPVSIFAIRGEGAKNGAYQDKLRQFSDELQAQM